MGLLPPQALPASQHLSLKEGHFLHKFRVQFQQFRVRCQLVICLWAYKPVHPVWRSDVPAGWYSNGWLVAETLYDELHSLGVSACPALESLELSNSVNWSRRGSETLQLQINDRTVDPDSITSLNFFSDATIEVA